MIWYQATEDAVLHELNTSNTGLDTAEARRRLRHYGRNQLFIHKQPWWQIVIEPFKSVFIAVLSLAAFVSILSHEPLDAAIVGTIILINAIIFYTQHYATSRVLRSLRNKTIRSVTVIRAGKEQRVSSLELVPGDILLLAEGDKISADARVLHSDALQVDESTLTGESVPLLKHSSTLQKTHPIYEQDNMVFQGTYVVSGTARVIVVATGTNTEFGKIAKLAGRETGKSPVQQRVDELITLIIKTVAVASVLVFLLALARGITSGEALRFVLSLSVAAVPEGLPVALTAIVIFGMRRMAKQKALVRSFKAIEDVGLITTIATDKTGTLTKNRLRLIDMWSTQPNKMLREATAHISHSENSTDPLDAAIIEIQHHKTPASDSYYPFDLHVRMSGTYSLDKKTLFIKGSPEHILAKSTISTAQHRQAESAMHTMAAKGHRIIAVAKIDMKTPPKNLENLPKLNFLGFLAFADELRPEAKPAIAAAQSAGIHVRLITGDHFETAFNIGNTVGIAQHPHQVILGSDLPANSAALAATAKDKTVFARILPEDKFRILQALKQSDIVAMTGDGVNDVPALSNAHVGFAMGSGSDIAKDAAGIVLLNDNFATIVGAIREGRKIYDNIRKMIFYLLATSIGGVLTMIGALLFGMPLPVTAIQILWINLITDTAMVLPLGLEPEEDNIMKRPPRKPNEKLLTNTLLVRMCMVAATMAIITLATVSILQQQGQSTQYIQTVAFMALVVAQWVNAFNARSEIQSSFTRLGKANYGLLVGFLISVGLQLIAMYGPLRSVVDVVEVPAQTLLIASGIMAVGVFVAAELHKYILRDPQKNNTINH